MIFKNPSVILYFLAYMLYLFFFRFSKNMEMALVFKPMILASMFFYYLLSKKTRKKEIFHFLILGILFIADNVNLLLETVFYELALSLYLVVLSIFMYQILKDSKLIKEDTRWGRYFGLAVFIMVLAFMVLKIVSIYIVKADFQSYYFVVNYIVVFICVLFFSVYNYFKYKTTSSKFLLVVLLSLFFADLFSVIDTYYYQSTALKLISSIIEIPTYFLLVNYFINRDLELYGLNNNISS